MKKLLTIAAITLLSSSLFADGWSDMRKATGAKVTTKKSTTTKKDDRFKKTDKKKKEVKKKERKPLW